MTARYWYTNCPRCGDEGELLLSKKAATGEMCFQCAECSWACDDPSRVGDYLLGYEGLDVGMVVPTMQDIQDVGWQKFCVNLGDFDEEDE